MVKFSIITVCRNSAATIAKTINSVAEQSVADIEHIFIDGASTDDTLSIIKSLAGPNVTLVSEPDKGIYDAMNKGIALAKGDVIGLLNADDHYAHNAVLMDVAKAFLPQNIDVVFGDVGFFRQNAPDKIIRHYNSGSFNPKRIAFGIMPAHPATFLKREIYERFGSFKTDFQIAADFEFIARIFKSNQLRYKYLPEILVKMQSGGVSTKGLHSILTLNQEILRACRENDIRSSVFHLACKAPARLLELIRT